MDIQKSDEQWKKELTPEQYRVLREKGTEVPWSGEYVSTTDAGVYVCAACGNQLFSSERKYDAHCGWPSFDEALPGAVTFHQDDSFGMSRIEITCARCGGHLGHVFDDPSVKTTGKWFCANSASLELKKQEE